MARTSAMRLRIMSASQHFEQAGGAHPTTDAHRDHDELGAAAPALDERVPGETGARHPIGMAERDGAAVHVEPLVGNAQLVATVDHLHGEGFVELPQVDVLDLLAGTFEQL